jgi:polysaccharide pyruvyl transferase WcaK-like protein
MPSPPQVVIIGAHGLTGNLGVAALADGVLAGVFREAPDAEVTMLIDEPGVDDFDFELGGRAHHVRAVEYSFSKNIFRRNHVLFLFARALLAGLLPGGRRRILAASEPLAAIAGARLVGDVSGGDSFTDIYGSYRMLQQSLVKALVLLCGAPLTLLPQTIGPFRGGFAARAARGIMRRASAVYCRDAESARAAREILGGGAARPIAEMPDVSLLVEPQRPPDSAAVAWARERSGQVIVGLNVSGLLASGGYTRRNQFGLRCDYVETITAIAEALLEETGVSILFVPHVAVFPGHVEHDHDACRRIAEALPARYAERVFVADAEPTAARAKYIVGLCDFFAGSRMHSCLAALTLGVPAVGLAYSRKFRGVFESLGAAGSVVDLRQCGGDEAAGRVVRAFRERQTLRAALRASLPKARERLSDAFRAMLAVKGGAP